MQTHANLCCGTRCLEVAEGSVCEEGGCAAGHRGFVCGACAAGAARDAVDNLCEPYRATPELLSSLTRNCAARVVPY